MKINYEDGGVEDEDGLRKLNESGESDEEDEEKKEENAEEKKDEKAKGISTAGCRRTNCLMKLKPNSYFN